MCKKRKWSNGESNSNKVMNIYLELFFYRSVCQESLTVLSLIRNFLKRRLTQIIAKLRF